ncbi:MAG: D-alanine--D-alanine ligase family protein [Chlamydiota bacterium]
MRKKKRIAVLFGGQSAEHLVSLQSARAVIAHLNQDKYEVIPLGIDQQGGWHWLDCAKLEWVWENQEIPLIGEASGGDLQKPRALLPANFSQMIDVVFPVLHGPFGEDGTVQGLIRLAHLPCVGSGVLGSALCMDKSAMKKLLSAAGMPVARFLTVCAADVLHIDEIVDKLGLPLFVKPANLGSSIGISKVKSSDQLFAALEKAFLYDERAIIEECIVGREIECSVLGDLKPWASLPGEIFSQREFYDYEAKYIDRQGAFFELPARLPQEKIVEIQKLAVRAFQELQCSGMARVDFFLSDEGKIIINELNTIPGFTEISLYPKLWEVSGVSYRDLLDQLIELAINRFQRQQARGAFLLTEKTVATASKKPSF